MKCGKCKEDHDTVAEVRECYGLDALKLGKTSTERYGYGAETQAASASKLSGKQESYINDLLDARPMHRDVMTLWPDNIHELTPHEAHLLIEQLKEVPPEQSNDNAGAIPAGHYALEAQDGHVVFYRVDRPVKGKWAGYTFCVMLLGSPGNFDQQRLPRDQRESALDRIKQNPVEAAMRFSRKFTRCARCLSPLTQVRSRATGFGPVCSGYLGVTYLDRETAMHVLDEGVQQGTLTLEGLDDLEEVSA